MENNNTILNELRELSPVVAAVSNKQLYTVPPAYFENLAVQVLLRIAIEEKAGTDPVLNISKNNVYQVPENYFDALAGNIINRIKTQETGAREELEYLSPLLGSIGKKIPFTPPDDYFNDFSENMISGVKAIEFVNEELENLPPIMADLKERQVYQVPQGYFDTTAAVILQKAKQQPAKIISIGFGKVMRYAAAAVIAGVILFSGYKYYNNDATQLAASGYGKTPLTDSLSGLAKIPDGEMESFLNDNTISLADTDSTVSSTDDINDNDSKDLLANISDEELQQYVDQRPETPISN